MAQFNTAQWNGGDGSGTSGVTVTANSLIYQALRSLGVLYARQSASVDLMADGLELLNQLIDSWNTERMLLTAVTRDVYNLTAGQSDYTLGPGGDFDNNRAERIEAAGVVYTSGTTPIEGQIQIQALSERARILAKTVTGLPAYLYDDGGFPLRTLSLFPVPSVQALQIALYTWGTLQGFADLTTEYAFAPGYAVALQTNLALLLAPSVEINQKIAVSRLALIAENARKFKGVIKRANAPVYKLGCDSALVRPVTGRIESGFLR